MTTTKPKPNSGFGFPVGSNGKFAPAPKPKPVILKSAPTPLQGVAPTGMSPLFNPYQPPVVQQQTKATADASSTKTPAKTLSQQVTQPPTSFLDTLSKYESEAKSLGLGGGDGTDYDALINTLNQNGAQGAAKLAAIYSQLGGSVAADAPGIRSNFAGAGTALAANTAQASQADANAYDATKAAQTAQFAALGIPEAAAVLASNGGQAARDQNLAQSQLQLANAGNQAANTEHEANAVNYNTGVKESVGQQGAQAQSTLQQQLQSKLAEIEQAKAQAKTSNASSLFSAAQTLEGLDPNSAGNLAKTQANSTANDLSNQLKASQIALNYAKAQGSQKTIADALTGNLQATAAAQKFFVANGGNASDAKAFNQFLQNAKLAGSLSKK